MVSEKRNPGPPAGAARASKQRRSFFEHGPMISDVDDHHRVVRKVRVEIAPREVAFFCKAPGIVAITYDPLALGYGARLHIRFERGDDLKGDGVNRPDRRWRAIGPGHNARRIHEVAVRIDEARQKRLFAQLNDRRPRPLPSAQDIGLGASGDGRPSRRWLRPTAGRHSW